MTANWVFQGRQRHGWFGHGTAPASADALAALASRTRLVADYAEEHLPQAQRFSFARRMGEMGGLANLQAAMPAWVAEADAHPEAFRRRLLGADASASLARALQTTARGVRDAHAGCAMPKRSWT